MEKINVFFQIAWFKNSWKVFQLYELIAWTFSIDDDVAILAVSGSLMGGPTVVPFQHYVEEVMKDGIRNVVVDFSKVKWFGSNDVGGAGFEFENAAGGGWRFAFGRACKQNGEFDDGGAIVVPFSSAGICGRSNCEFCI